MIFQKHYPPSLASKLLQLGIHNRTYSVSHNIHSGLDFIWFHEILYIFVSYTKELPDLMTDTLSKIFLANLKIFYTRCISWNYPFGFQTNSQPIMRLQRRVIRQSNANFVGFLWMILKILKNYGMKRKLHFSGKWQNRQISQFTRYWYVWG